MMQGFHQGTNIRNFVGRPDKFTILLRRPFVINCQMINFVHCFLGKNPHRKLRSPNTVLTASISSLQAVMSHHLIAFSQYPESLFQKLFLLDNSFVVASPRFQL